MRARQSRVVWEKEDNVMIQLRNMYGCKITPTSVLKIVPGIIKQAVILSA